MCDYSYVTDEMFQNKLEEIVEAASTEELMSIPGISEILREHYNNDVLCELDEEREEE
jgi:hypothetical protein